jgi:para-nitrobenzyl esterase
VPNGNIVLVTINYRLGALGFLHLKEITGGGIPATGCEGLLDQVAALRWVQANIRNFGGDPENITVFGESAGGMSIGCLMSMPAARGTFQKCILQSGAANTVASLEEGTSAAREFLDVLKLNPDSVDTLRSLSADRLMAAQEKLGAVMLSRDNRITPFQPVVDGTEMPDIPIQAIQKGFASGIATLIGTNLDEFKLFVAMDPGYRDMDKDGMIRRLGALIPLEYVPKVTAAYRKAREKRGDPVQPGEILTAIQTDLMFRIPAIHLATAQRDNGCPTYTYLFSRKSPVLGGALGACHALEIGFVFGNYEESFCGTGPEVETLSRQIQDAWTAFARTGNPSCASLGEWKGYGSSQTTMILDTRCRMEDAPYNEEKSVWDGLGLLFTKPI